MLEYCHRANIFFLSPKTTPALLFHSASPGLWFNLHFTILVVSFTVTKQQLYYKSVCIHQKMNWSKWQDIPINKHHIICVWKFGTWGIVFGGSQNCLERESRDGRWKLKSGGVWIHMHHLLGSAEQSSKTMYMPWWLMPWDSVTSCFVNATTRISSLGLMENHMESYWDWGDRKCSCLY